MPKKTKTKPKSKAQIAYRPRTGLKILVGVQFLLVLWSLAAWSGERAHSIDLQDTNSVLETSNDSLVAEVKELNGRLEAKTPPVLVSCPAPAKNHQISADRLNGIEVSRHLGDAIQTELAAQHALDAVRPDSAGTSDAFDGKPVK